MLDESTPGTTTDPSSATTESTPTATRRRRAASRPAGPPPANNAVSPPETTEPADAPIEAPVKKSATTRAPRKRAVKKAAPATDASAAEPTVADPTEPTAAEPEVPARKATKRASRARTTKQDAAAERLAEPTPEPTPTSPPGPMFSAVEETPTPTRRRRVTKKDSAADPVDAAEPADADPAASTESVMFQAPDPAAAPTPRRRTRKAGPPPDATEPTPTSPVETAVAETADSTPAADHSDDSEGEDEQGDAAPRRRRRRGGRRRRRGSGGVEETDTSESDGARSDDSEGSSTESGRPRPEGDQQVSVGDEGADDESEGTTRRRRRRRRRGEGSEPSQDDPANTVVRIRERRAAEDEISSISGSTRLEAKKQRRREGRDAGRRRAPIVSESEFLARRESVKREMVIRQRKDLSQIAVLEDGVLVEHYVARDSQTSLIGNVYLGRVQNVLPSMEAAFIDIGKGRNAVLYAGEVDWKAVGAEGRSRKIEEVLKSGQSILVQVTKDPVGNKGARLTGQVSLPGRFLVYVPGGQSSGISRKLPDTERARLKALLKDTLPEGAGVIIRTAAEGATEEQLTRDVGALTARWEDIERKSKASSNAPQLLYGEPDLMIKVVRDLFNEDFSSLVVHGDDAWDMIDGYVTHVAPDLSERLSRWGEGSDDSFAAHRIDEQIAKALDRKVWLPSGGSLVIDRTEAMTVVDVNTGKFTGSGGNLEETVTKNNLEAAEEIVRQLRLRDIGGIIVVDFIDMVLEDNRDLVLRRMIECLGRDRTRHQVAEVTSLGLVQMTRKRIGTGLLEAFSESCEHCHGRGLNVHTEPVEPARQGGGGGVSSIGNPEDSSSSSSSDDGNGRRGRRGRGRGGSKRGDGDTETAQDDSTTEQGAPS